MERDDNSNVTAFSFAHTPAQNPISYFSFSIVSLSLLSFFLFLPLFLVSFHSFLLLPSPFSHSHYFLHFLLLPDLQGLIIAVLVIAHSHQKSPSVSLSLSLTEKILEWEKCQNQGLSHFLSLFICPLVLLQIDPYLVFRCSFRAGDICEERESMSFSENAFSFWISFYSFFFCGTIRFST